MILSKFFIPPFIHDISKLILVGSRLFQMSVITTKQNFKTNHGSLVAQLNRRDILKEF